MTWREFKARVEEQGVGENTEIAWIDVLGFRHSPIVTKTQGGAVVIVQRDHA